MTRRSSKAHKPRRRIRDFFHSQRRRETAALRPLAVELLEDRRLLAADLLFQAAESGDLTLRLSEGTVQILDSREPSTVLASKPLDEIMTGVQIEGNTYDVRLTIDASVPPIAGGILFVGGTGTNALTGPDADTDWIIDAPGSGSFGGVNTFTGVESLIGGAGDDSFKFEQDGAIPGGIDGGGDVDGDAILGPYAVNVWSITGTNAGSLNGNGFAGTENLIGGNQDDRFVFQMGGAISGLIDGGVDDAPPDDGSPAVRAVDRLDYSGLDTAVEVDLAAATSTGAGSFAQIDQVKGSSDSDRLFGPDELAVEWTIDGPNAGQVGGVAFEGFENLTGVSDSASDVFTFEEFGSLSGIVDGGANPLDGIQVFKEDGLYTVFNPAAGIDASGTISLNGKTIQYAGMDHQDLVSDDGGYNLVIRGTNFKDSIVIEDTGTSDDGQMRIRFGGIEISDGVDTSDAIEFTVPADSLTIEAGMGADEILVDSLDGAFAADLLLYGGELNSYGYPRDDLFSDAITFRGSIDTQGGFLDAWADHVTVDDGVQISIGDNDVVFRARRIGFPVAENLIPGYGTAQSVSIQIGADAQLIAGGGIYLVAQAEDKSLSDLVGGPKEVNEFIIQPLLDTLTMPVKVLVKNSTAAITLREGAQLLAGGTIGLYATAAADASGSASGSMISVGYCRAVASATVDIQRDVQIASAEEAVVITASGGATASISSSTARSLDSTPNPGGKQIAASIAVSDAHVTSQVTVAEGAAVTAGKTANIAASGDVSSEAAAESGMYSDGAAGLAFGIEYSKADIHTTIDGSVTAQMNPGSAVKIEIDPTVAASDYESSQSVTGLAAGKTVYVAEEVNSALPAGTVFEYAGPELTGTVDLSTQDYADGTTWLPISEPVGYVDYDHDMIHVGPHALVTEDVIIYTNRFGTSIGNMVDGREYFVLGLEDDPTTPGRDESAWIKLSETEAGVLRAGMGFEDDNVVDLGQTSGVLATALNERAFDGTDIDAVADSILLRDAANDNFNKFELGQAVVYQEADSPIEGLTDGGTYYVIVGNSENNLQGDTRFANGQVVQLAESENEARAGVAIDIGSSSGSGYTLSAKHVLDSGFSTGIGIGASLSAEDKASASAGLESEDSNPSKWDKLNDAVDTNITDSIFTKLTKSYSDHAAKANAGSSNTLSVAGALAFAFADHTVRADVGSAAVLKSNEDLEVLANIEESFQINAESTFEPQENAQGESAGSSAENAVSVAVNVGIFQNAAAATVHDGARMDGLRATRVIGGVLYPFLTRPDTYVPTSAGEFVDSVRTDGAEAVTKYLDFTLGMKDSFFNSWAASTASSDQLSIAGSVNVLVMMNEAEAIVESGVEINQDADWHDDTRNPHPNQAAQQADGLGEQVVTVMATNYMQTINMTGIFSLPDLTIDPTDKGKNKLTLPSAFGSEGGGKGGMGGAFFITVQNNTTHAIVEDGATISSGGDGGFNIDAREAIFAINLTQAGASAGKLAIGGSVAYVGVTNDTLARLGNRAVVTGREVRVTASDFESQINWVGGVAKGENVGVGIAVAVNTLDRKTRAVIGDPDVLASSGEEIASSTSIDVTGKVGVHAVVDGELWAFTVAGAAVTGTEPDQGGSGSAFADDDPLDGQSLPALFNEDVASEQSQAKSGIGIAAAVSINLVWDDTRASIADAGQIAAGDVFLVAESELSHVAATGGAAFAKSGSGGQSTNALAGALSFNNLDIKTRALLIDTAVTSGGLIVDARRSGDLITVSAGAAGASSGNGTTVAGSVSVNRLVNTTTALLDVVRVVASGAGTISAQDVSDIIAIGGGAAIGGAKGFGFSLGFNEITGDTLASVQDSTLHFGGVLSLTAKNDNALRSVGVSAGVGKDIGVAFTLGINLIHNTDRAEIVDSTLTGAASVALLAQDDSVLQAIGGALGIGLNSTGFGGALGWNSVTNAITARIERSTLSEIDGGVSVIAISSEEDPLADGKIISLAIGAAGSKDTAIGGALSMNVIMNTVDARISDASSVATVGDVTVSATDSSSIDALAFGGAASASVAGGVAISVNVITNAISTEIAASAVSAGSDVDVIAASTAIIRALAIGVSGSSSTAVSISALGNAVANDVTAAIRDSTVNAGGDLQVAASDVAPSVIPDWLLSDEQQTQLDTALEHSPLELQANILSIMVSVAGSGSVAVSGAVSGNVITNNIRAEISGSVVDLDGKALVTSLSDSGIIAITVGVGASGSVAVQASGFGNVITNRIEAVIDGGSTVIAGGLIDLSADDSSSISSVAVSVAGSGSVAVSAIVGANVITDTISAGIADSTVTSGTTLEIDAKSQAGVYAFATGVGASGVVAVQALIAANVIVDDTSATVTNSTVDAGDAVSLAARNASSIDALVVGVAASGTAAVTVPLVVNDITNTTEAVLAGSALTTDWSLAIAAESSNVIRALSVGVSASGTVAVTVSGLGNVITNTLNSLITGSTVVAAGGVSLSANDIAPSVIPDWLLPESVQEDVNTALADSPIDLDTNILAVMVSVSGSGMVAVSGTVSGNVIVNDITADIVQSEVTSGGSVSLDASTDSGIIALIVGVGGSGVVAVDASGFGNVITNTVEAMIEDGSTVDATGSVDLAAYNEAIIRSVAVSVAASGCVAVSAIIGANVIVSSLAAGIANSTVTSGTSASVDAKNKSNIYAFATGVGVSGIAAVQALIAANVVVDSTSATITNSTVDAGDAVTLTADDTSAIDALVVGVAASGEAAVEVPVVVNDITNSTVTEITGSNLTSDSSVTLAAESSNVIRALSVGVSASGSVAVTVAGLGNVITNTLTSQITGSTIVAAGGVSLSAEDVAPSAIPDWLLPAEKLDQVNTALEDSPIDLDANILAILVSVSGSGKVAVSGAASGNVIANTITADIVDSDVSSGGPVSLDASTDSGIIALTVGVGGSGAVAVDASLFGNVIANTVEAMIAETSTVNAAGAVELAAVNESVIRSVAVSVAASGGVAISAIVGANVITGSVVAGIADSTVTCGTTLDIDARTESTVYAFATGVGAAGATAVQALIAANVIANTTSAAMTNSTADASDAISLTAKDTATIDAFVVGVAAGSGAAVEVPIVVNDITNTTETSIADSTVTTDADLALVAESSNVIRAISVGVSASGTVAVTVAGLGNVITNALTSEISGSTIAAAGGVSLAANDIAPSVIPEWILPEDKREQIDAAVEDSPFDLDTNILAILASISGSGSVAVSGVVSGNVIANTIRADIVGSEIAAGGSVALDASTDSGIIALSVGVGAAKYAAISATGFGNVITNTVATTIDGGSLVAGSDEVDLVASDQSRIRSAALSIAGSGGVAVSVVIGANVITNRVTALISGSTVTAGTTVNVEAETDSVIYSFAGGVAFSTVAGAATLAANVVTNTTEALIENGTVSAGSVAVLATDTATIESLSGEVAIGLVGGLGGGAAYNVIANTVKGRVLNSSVSSAAGNVVVEAIGAGTIEAVAAGGAGGMVAGVAGTIAIQTIANTIEALIDTSTVSATGTVLVLARWDGEITADGGTGAVGGYLGVGGTIVTNTLANSVSALIDDSTVTASGTGTGVTISRWSKAANAAGWQDDRLAEATETFYGVAVVADNVEAIDSSFATGSIGAVGLAVNRAVNLVTDITQAAISDSSIAEQLTGSAGVAVRARQSTHVTNQGGVVGVSGVGVVGGFDTTLIDNTTQASIENPGAIKAVHAGSGGVEVSAWNQDVVSSQTGSAGVSALGAAGAVSAVEITSDTRAHIERALVTTAGILNVLATRIADVTTKAGAISVSLLAGVGGSVDYVTIAGETEASVTAASVDVAGDTTIRAISYALIDGRSGTAGAGGIASVVGAASVHSIETVTQASLGNGPSLQPRRNVTIQAVDHAAIDSSAGSVAGSLVAGVGGSLDVGVIRNSATAEIGQGVSLQAGGDVIVDAQATQDVASSAKGYTIGLLTGICGSISAIGIGGGLSDEAHDEADRARTTINGLLDLSGGIDGLADDDVSAQIETTLSAHSLTIDAAITADPGTLGSIRAEIGTLADVTVGGDVQIVATVTPRARASAQGVAASAGVSVGASKADVTVSPTVTAQIGGAITADTLSVLAQQVLPGEDVPTADAFASGASGGLLLGVDASSSTATGQAVVTSRVRDLAQLNIAEAAAIVALGNSRQQAESTNVVAGLIAGGKAEANANAAGTTRALLGAGVTFTGGDLTVSAAGADENRATGTAGSGGVVSGNAVHALTSDASTVTTSVGHDASVDAGDVTLTAQHTSSYATHADSVNAAVVGGSGAYADSTVAAAAAVNIADDAAISATGAVLVSSRNETAESSDQNNTEAGSGGVISGSAAKSRAVITGSSTVTFGGRVTVDSGTDPVSNPGGIWIGASSLLFSSDHVNLQTGGAIIGGGVDSSLEATLTNSVNLGTNGSFRSTGNIGAGTWTIVSAEANAEINTWGVAGVGVADASLVIATDQAVTVGSGTQLEAFGNVNLTAGQDPAGFYETSLSGRAIAQGYVRALIAVPHSEADAELHSNASLDIASGTQIKSGQNVTIGAYGGSLTPVADGTGHGYELGFIPVTQSDSDVSASTSERVTHSGTITAGIYHALDITIPANAADPDGFSATLSAAAGGAPFTWSYDPAFSPPAFIAEHFTGTEADLLTTGTSSVPVGAMTLGTLYAAGGTVTINADQILGNGTVTAYGGPSITVTNHSLDYLILGAVKIPNTPGGKVIFTGEADGDDAAALTISEVGEDQSPVVTITNAYDGAVGDSASGPALFLSGAVENLGGLVSITNVSGSLGQTATIYGQQVNISIPQGVTVIDFAGDQPYYAGGNPYSQWAAYMAWPGGNPAASVPSASAAIAYVANAVYNSAGSYATPYLLTHALIGRAGETVNGTSTVYYGNGVPWVDSLNQDSSKATAKALSPIGQAYAISPDHEEDDEGWFAMVPNHNLTATATSYAQNPAGFSGSEASSAIFGGQVSINAKYIDVNGKISAGQATDWSVALPSSLTVRARPAGSLFERDLSLSEYRSFYLTGRVPRTVALPVQAIRSGESTITAEYDAKANLITLSNVSASSGSGYVSIHGGILSTNTLGNIHVNGGLGRVEVDNNTGIPLVVQNVFAGSTSLISSMTSQVEIIDTLKDSASNHWLYVYQPGSGVSVYHGAADQTLGEGTPESQTAGTAATYNPDAGLRWEWQQAASLSRTIDSSNWVFSNWNWSFPAGQPNDPWQYVDPAGGYSTTPKGKLIEDATDTSVFRQTITGSSGSNYRVNVKYHESYDFAWDGESYEDDGRKICWWHYSFPRTASLTMTMSVKADNPIAIDFSGRAAGQIYVSSNSAVTLAGNITNPDGEVRISARGDIMQNATGTILANDLILDATGRIGRADRPLPVTLTDDGVLDVRGGAAGVCLALGSGAQIDRVASFSKDRYGPVVVTAAGDLLAGPAALHTSDVHVTGSSIALTSTLGAVGADSAPLILGARPLVRPGMPREGSVRISALNDIVLLQRGDDLLVETIESQTGSVSIAVTGGSLFDSRGQTAASVLDAEQTAQVWSRLHLTAENGAEANAQLSVSVSETLVQSHYQEYWRLRQNGGVSGETYTLSPLSIPLYRPRAAAALQRTSPTDAQVQDYAAHLYAAVLAFFDNAELAANTELGLAAIPAPLPGLGAIPGADWRTQSDFVTFNPGFSFTASTPQAAELTKNAVWTENELRYAIDRTALNASSGTPVGTGIPNVIGRNVTLTVSEAAGRLGDPLFIAIKALREGNLTAEQAGALALATAPGDVILVGTDAEGVTVDYQFGSEPEGVTLTGIKLNETQPVFVASSGTLTSTMGGTAYIQSTRADLALAAVEAGGDLSLAAPGSLHSAGTDEVPIKTSGDLRLLAGTGGIVGDAATGTPLVVQVSGTLTSANAGGNVRLEQRGGDLTFDRISSGAEVELRVPAGGLYQATAGTGIQSDDLTIEVDGTVGTSTAFVEILLDAAGELSVTAPDGVFLRSMASANIALVSSENADVTLEVRGDAYVDQIEITAPEGTTPAGIVSLFADGGIYDRRDAAVTPQPDAQSNIDAPSAVLNARTGLGTQQNLFETRLAALEASSLFGDIWLQNYGDLEIGNISEQVGIEAHGTTHIFVASKLIIAEPIVSAGGDVPLQASEDILVNAAITSGGGNVTLNAGGGISMADSVSIDAGGGTIDLDAVGDITISLLTTTGTVDVNSAAGSILDGDTTGANDIEAGSIILSAGLGIGEATNELETDCTGAEGFGAIAAGTGVYLTETAGGLKLSTVTSTSGDIRLTVNDSLDSGDDIRMDQATDAVTATEGSVTLQAGDGIVIAKGTVTAGGDVSLTSDYGSIDGGTAPVAIYGTVQAGGTLSVAASGDVVGDSSGRITAHAFDARGRTVGGLGDGALNIDLTGGTLTAVADVDISIREVAGPLNVGYVFCITGGARLEAADTAGDDDDLAFGPGSSLTVATLATLIAGDDLLLNPAAPIRAGSVVLVLDAAATDPDPGSGAMLDFSSASFVNPVVQVRTGADNDTIVVSDLAEEEAVLDIHTGGGDDQLQLGGTAHVLAWLRGSILFDGSSGSDRIEVNASAGAVPGTGALWLDSASTMPYRDAQIPLIRMSGMGDL